MLNLKKIILLLAVVFFAQTANADCTSQLKTLLTNIQTFQSDFTQSGLSPSTGKFALQKPGKFLWLIKTPSEQKIVADGKQVRVYDVGLNQVRTLPLGNQPAALLSGSTDELDRYDITCTGNQYTLTPKQEGSVFAAIVLNFKNGVLKGMRLDQGSGQDSTMFQFLNSVQNKKLSPTLFELKMPKNVRDVDNAAH